jgi:F-type H+-transporting ATPase subunit a
MSADIFSYKAVKPFEALGLTGNFWTIHLDILTATWIAMGWLLALALLGRYLINRKQGLTSLAYQSVVSLFVGLCEESFPTFNYNYFAFISSIFFFTLFCCLVGVIPFVEEATRDINTTVAIACTSFLYVQIQQIKVHGFLGYLKEFTQPFIIMLPMHVIGELSKIASMSFRLFGNILGGSVILAMLIELLGKYKTIFLPFMIATITIAGLFAIPAIAKKIPFLSKFSSLLVFMLFLITWVQVLFGIVEGVIQSFVLTMLTVTYLSIGTTTEEMTHEHKEAT